jgi:hypothetical protein
MKRSNTICGAAAVAALMACGAIANAGPLLYSFESPAVNPDGFGPNGGGVTITQDTIGATDGTHSMKVAVVAGATFVGALTSNVAAPLAAPPISPQEIDFDYTIAQGSTFTGAFAVLGITMFGFNGPLGQFGLQAQFAPLVHLEGVAPGTYHGSIALTGATNPLDFTTNESYNQIFTAGTPAANQLTPSGFQFFLNKSNDAPATVYIDNVTLGPVPEPTSLAVLGGGAMVLGIRRRRRT